MAVSAVEDAAIAASAVSLLKIAILAVLDAITAVIAALDAITASIAVLDAATASIVVNPLCVALLARLSVRRKPFRNMPTLLLPSAADVAVLLAAIAVIVTLFATILRTCPGIASSTCNSPRRELFASSVCSCAPVRVPFSSAFNMRIAESIAILSPYVLMTVTGHAAWMAALAVAAAALALVSITVTVLAALTQA